MKRIKKSQFALPSFMRSRWFILGVGLVIIVGGGVAYAWWSKNSWTAYEKKYTSIRQDIDTKLTGVFSLQSDTTQQRDDKRASLGKLSADIEGIRGDFCRPNALIGWQNAFNEYKTQEESCKAAVNATKAFSDQLKQVVEYLQQEQALARQLASAPTQAEVAEGDFEGQLTTWRSVNDGIKNASASVYFDPVKRQAVSVTGEIVKNWEEVIAAHRAKDKARYTKAVQALAAAYDGVSGVSSTNTTHLTEVTMKLKKAYAQLH